MTSTATRSKHPPPSSFFLEEEEELEEESDQYLDAFHMFGKSPPPSPVHPYQNSPRHTLEGETEQPEEISETCSVEETTTSTSAADRRRSRRRVRFNPVIDQRDSSTTYSSLQDRKSRWYTRTELHAMKQAAVRLAKYSHHQHMVQVMSARQQGQPQQQQQQQQQPPPMPRGLEGCTVERLKHKAMTIKCVVMTYKKTSRKYRENITAKKSGDKGDAIYPNNDDETDLYVAQLSMKLSKWNTDLAFLQGCLDYFESYRPELLPDVPTLQSIGPPPRIHFTPKRGSSASSSTTTWQQQQEHTRRVRQKRCYVEGPPSA